MGSPAKGAQGTNRYIVHTHYQDKIKEFIFRVTINSIHCYAYMHNVSEYDFCTQKEPSVAGPIHTYSTAYND
jgi:hypothetical protein